METTETASVREIWLRAFNHVRTHVDVATVWLAMQAAVPLAIDGHYFVVGLSDDNQFLAGNLQNHEATSAIEDALQQITGRVLAFHLISGTTLADWEAQRAPDTAPTPTAPPEPGPSAATVTPPSVTSPINAAPPPADAAPTWEKLTERLTQGYKTAPVKYAQGQARYILHAARMISDTMDLLLPAPGQPPDEAQERTLAKVVERFGSLINLDPLFISLEVMRYRQSQGKEQF